MVLDLTNIDTLVDTLVAVVAKVKKDYIDMQKAIADLTEAVSGTSFQPQVDAISAKLLTSIAELSAVEDSFPTPEHGDDPTPIPAPTPAP
jgi:3-oxoacyl-ACP reductase-like protein